uniref:Uncharacterized protein n=1 Tax=Canis lupus familiaris TaxID=9615 RepID=A0A8I3MV53_CANLF
RPTTQDEVGILSVSQGVGVGVGGRGQETELGSTLDSVETPIRRVSREDGSRGRLWTVPPPAPSAPRRPGSPRAPRAPDGGPGRRRRGQQGACGPPAPGRPRVPPSPGPATCGHPPRPLTWPLQFQPVGVAAVGHQRVGLLRVGPLLARGLAVVAGPGAAALAAGPLGEAVAVPPVRVAVARVVAEAAVMVEEAQPHHVDQQPGHADPEDHQRLLHLVRLDEALDGLQQDGEAEAGQEDGVHQGPHHLGPDPAERVLLGGVGPPGEALGHQRHHQRQHVRQHVEGVGEHRQGRGHLAHHHLEHHEHEELDPSSSISVLQQQKRREKSFPDSIKGGIDRSRW